MSQDGHTHSVLISASINLEKEWFVAQDRIERQALVELYIKGRLTYRQLQREWRGSRQAMADLIAKIQVGSLLQLP